NGVGALVAAAGVPGVGPAEITFPSTTSVQALLTNPFFASASRTFREPPSVSIRSADSPGARAAIRWLSFEELFRTTTPLAARAVGCTVSATAGDGSQRSARTRNQCPDEPRGREPVS